MHSKLGPILLHPLPEQAQGLDTGKDGGRPVPPWGAPRPPCTLLIRVLGATYHCSSILPASRREGNPSPARSAEGDLPTTLASPKAAAPCSDFGAPWQNRNCKLQLVGLQWSPCSPKHPRLVSFTLCAWAPSSPGKSRWDSSPLPAGMDQVRPFIPLLVGGTLALICGALGVILHHR